MVKEIMLNKISKILAIALVISISCNIIGVYLIVEIKTVREQQQEPWKEEMEQRSYGTALAGWENFDCTFDNKTLTLETEGYSFGNIAITIFSDPQVNISLDYWDKYQTTEKWEEKNGEIWIEDADGDIRVFLREMFEIENHIFFDSMNKTVHSWHIFTPPNSWTQHVIIVHDNISSNLTIVVLRDFEPFKNYDGVIYRFKPVIHTFKVKI